MNLLTQWFGRGMYICSMAKKKDKPSKEELQKTQEKYYKSIPEEELNPNHKEDFDAALEKLFGKKQATKKEKE